eukprot:gene8456-8640_t
MDPIFQDLGGKLRFSGQVATVKCFENNPLVRQGAIIYGCIRDSEDISKMPLGVKALGTYPLKSSKRDPGLSDVPVTIAGVTVSPGDWVYADKDGILVSKEELKL